MYLQFKNTQMSESFGRLHIIVQKCTSQKNLQLQKIRHTLYMTTSHFWNPNNPYTAMNYGITHNLWQFHDTMHKWIEDEKYQEWMHTCIIRLWELHFIMTCTRTSNVTKSNYPPVLCNNALLVLKSRNKQFQPVPMHNCLQCYSGEFCQQPSWWGVSTSQTQQVSAFVSEVHIIQNEDSTSLKIGEKIRLSIQTLVSPVSGVQLLTCKEQLSE